MRRGIKSFPETVTVVSQNGRPDDGTDATGFFNAEFFVPLKPFDTWPSGVDKEKLTQQVNAALEVQFPVVEFNFHNISRTMSKRRHLGSRRRTRSNCSAMISPHS